MPRKLSKHILKMCDLERSDFMLCTNSAYLHYKDQKFNDSIFVQQMSRTRPQCIRNIDNENNMYITQSSRLITCNNFINSRGGNVGCEPVKPCPEILTSYNIPDFLLIPCPKNTYKNYQVFDEHKQCSKSHQILNNWTKRKELTGYEDVIR